MKWLQTLCFWETLLCVVIFSCQSHEKERMNMTETNGMQISPKGIYRLEKLADRYTRRIMAWRLWD